MAAAEVVALNVPTPVVSVKPIVLSAGSRT
jgi:hypothetical protein